jgi:hypothetical protein
MPLMEFMMSLSLIVTPHMPSIPPEPDPRYYIEETRFGLFNSILHDSPDRSFVTSLAHEAVASISTWLLDREEDGTLRVVGGKL